MQALICKDKNSWNNDFSKEFIQSWQWGEFQRNTGSCPIRIQMKEKSSVFWQAQGFEYKVMGLIKFIYFPKVSFVGLSEEQKVFFLGFLKKQGYVFTRIEPVDKIGQIGDFKAVKVKNRQPKNTFVLNIDKEEDELLEKMHPKTRYNIRLSERKGTTVKEEKNIDVFWDLNKETSARDKFKSYNKEYYEKMLELDFCYQLTAYIDDVPLVSNICINFADVFTYLHGASSNKNRNLMAPYFLQWECIKFARSQHATEYDFGGIAPVYPSGVWNR